MIKNDLINKKILAIETSCDETAISLIQNNDVMSNIILSSATQQSNYGGVVPELAARAHEQNIIKALKLATKDLHDLREIDYIAYSYEPGLRVCLNVGEIMAQTLANFLNAKLIKVNHLYGHIFSFWNMKDDINYPFLGVVVSGGNTNIYLVNNIYDIKLLNSSTDDAIGECYDKVARSLGLGYPGGPKIDQLFDEKDANITFINKNGYNDDPFSFSGLKTSILNYINQTKMKNENLNIVSVASSFQKQIIDLLIQKIQYYLDKYQISSLSLGGGVAANNYLREKIINLNLKNIYLAPKNLCGDNALMIAIYAKLLLL